MNEYLIYTTEGFTQSPDEIDIENCQILGRIIAENKNQAKELLKKENPWIEEIGFDIENAFVQQVLSKENKEDLKKLLDYLWDDEKSNFEEDNYSQDHIFRTMSKLKQLCEK